MFDASETCVERPMEHQRLRCRGSNQGNHGASDEEVTPRFLAFVVSQQSHTGIAAVERSETRRSVRKNCRGGHSTTNQGQLGA
jgi:hypothetical protein